MPSLRWNSLGDSKKARDYRIRPSLASTPEVASQNALDAVSPLRHGGPPLKRVLVGDEKPQSNTRNRKREKEPDPDGNVKRARRRTERLLHVDHRLVVARLRTRHQHHR